MGRAPDIPPKLPTPWIDAMGNCATPQRHEHVQEPSEPVEPVPDATLGGAADAAAGGGAAALEAGGGGAAAALVEVLGAPAVAVPFCCMAICMNIA